MFKTTIKIFLSILVLQLTLHAREINIDKLIDNATKEDKHLFVWLHKTGCGYCENMREFTLENEAIKVFIDKYFIFVHINVSQKDIVIYKDFQGSGREFAQHIGYDFYPTSLFFDDNGEIVYEEVGYRDTKALSNEKRFYKILNFIKSKSYKEVDYEEYKYEAKEGF